MNNQIQKICITVNETEYEAVIKEDLIEENCCSMCDLNCVCQPDTQLSILCDCIGKIQCCGCYFIEV